MKSFEDPFESPRLVLANARTHLRTFEHGIHAFLDEQPWSGFVDNDRQSGETLLKFRFTGKIPRSLSVVAFDVATNLRSVLDQAVYAAAVVVNGGDPKGTRFPFSDTVNGLDAEIRRIKRAPPEILDLIRGFQPYPAGNPVLWSLNKLRNRKNHVALIPIGARAGSVGFGNGYIHHAEFSICSEWDREKNELTVCRIAPGAKMNLQISATFQIAIDGMVRPAVQILNRIASEVEGILLALEAEALRVKANRTHSPK